MMRNAAERKDIRRVEKFAAERERARIEFVIAAMDTSQGRAWFHDFISRCRVFADPFSGDALVEAYSKGERNIGLGVYLDIVTHCPDQFVAMMKEAQIQEQVNGRRSDTADDELARSENADGGDY